MSRAVAAAAALGPSASGVLDGFEDATLDLLEAQALLTRVDRKFLLSQELLAEILPRLAGDYQLLRAAGEAAATYDTQYFDTGDLRLYHDHRRGRLPRYKVRIRVHRERRLTFLEVKHRRAAAGTSKTRLPLPFAAIGLDAAARQFVAAHAAVAAAALRPSMQNTFRRITLLGRDVDERLTIDTGISISDGSCMRPLPGLVVLEVKQGRYSNSTPSLRAVRALHVPERAISKYCLAVATLTAARHNTFKPALRIVERCLA